MTRDRLKAALTIAMGLHDGRTLSDYALEEAGLYGPPREPDRGDKMACVEIIMEWFDEVEHARRKTDESFGLWD